MSRYLSQCGLDLLGLALAHLTGGPGRVRGGSRSRVLGVVAIFSFISASCIIITFLFVVVIVLLVLFVGSIGISGLTHLHVNLSPVGDSDYVDDASEAAAFYPFVHDDAARQDA